VARHSELVSMNQMATGVATVTEPLEQMPGSPLSNRSLKRAARNFVPKPGH